MGVRDGPVLFFKKIKKILFIAEPLSPFRDRIKTKKTHGFRDQFISFILLLLIWEIFSRSGIVIMAFFPPPSRVIADLPVMIFDPKIRFFWHLSATLMRVSVGFIIGCTLALAFGILAGIYDRFNNFFKLTVDFLFSIPRILFLTTFMMLFGFGESMRYDYIAFATFFYSFYIIRLAVRGINIDFIDSAKIEGANKFQAFFYTWPTAAIGIIEGIKQAVITAWAATFIAESRIVVRGLGFMNVRADDLWDIERSFAILLVIGIMCIATIQIPEWLKRLAAEYWPTEGVK